MFPSFDIGFLSFPAYFTLLMTGFLAAIFLASRQADRLAIDPNLMLDLGIIAVLAGIGGSRALHVVADGYIMDYVHLCTAPLEVEPQELPRGRLCGTDEDCVKADKGELCHPEAGTCHPGRDCLRAFKFWYGGLTYYGGFIGAYLASIWFIRRRKAIFWRVADLGGFGIALGLVFGRLGCYLSGCCFGATTHSWIGIAFPRKSPAWSAHLKEHLINGSAAESLHVYPTQLFHAVGNLAVFGITFWIFRRHRSYDGKVLAWFLALYGIERFIIEYWRADQRGEWLWGLMSTSQLISLPLIGAAFYMMVYLKRRRALVMPDADLMARD